MKIFILIFAAWIALFLLFYLSGCFSEASFNLADWNERMRNGIAIGYLCISIVATLGICIEKTNK